MVDLNSAREQSRQFRLRLALAGVMVLLAFTGLGARLWWLQVEQHSLYVTRAENNRISVRAIAPRRGEIFDRNGIALARNVSTWTLELVPAEVPDIDDTVARLAQLVAIDEADEARFRRLLRESSRFSSIPLRTHLSETEAARFAAERFHFPGVDLRSRWMREYPHGAVGAHVIGYINRISAKDAEWLEEEGLSSNYRATQHIGKQGVEKSYESLLHGKVGAEAVEVTARGKPVRALYREEPQAGRDLRLSIDIHLQRVAEQALGDQRGAVVAIEPATGDILAFVSQPSFDPNLFVNGIDTASWRELSESPDKPLLNRPLSGTYPVGSTFKPFMALAALELGIREAHDTIYDPGYFELAGHRFRNAGSVAYGRTNLHRSLVVSSDTYYYSLASEMGVNRIHDFMKPFGFGQITGIDLDNERAGILPSTEWKRQHFRDPEQQRWYNGETVSVGVGQGYNAFTILQLAQATAVLANGGTYMRPHVVKSVMGRNGEPEIPTVPGASYTIPLQPRHVDIVRDALVDVNRSGTARRVFQDTPYDVAGKTGTAQVFSLDGANYDADEVAERLRDHALYMAFAPAYQPAIALAVLVENGGWGGAAAAPVARAIFDYWLLERHPQSIRQLQAEAEEAAQAPRILAQRAADTAPRPQAVAQSFVRPPPPQRPAAGSNEPTAPGTPRASFSVRTLGSPEVLHRPAGDAREVAP